MKPLILTLAVLIGWNATALANPIKSAENVTDVSYDARTSDLFTEPTFQRKGLNECLWNGRSYKDEEVIDITEMPCRVCYCKTGDVRCSDVSCYEREDCEGMKIPGTCCPKYDHCPPIGSTEPKKNYGTAENTFSVGQSPDKREFFSWKSDGSNSGGEKTQARDERSSKDENALTIVMKRVKNITSATSGMHDATDATVYPAVDTKTVNENKLGHDDSGNATVGRGSPIGNFDFYGDEENAVPSSVPPAVANSGDRPVVYGGVARTVGNLMLIADELEESVDEPESTNDTKASAEEEERHEIYGRKGSAAGDYEEEVQAKKSTTAGLIGTDENLPSVRQDESSDRNKPLDASELKLDEPEVLPLLGSGARLNALDADERFATSTNGANEADISSTATDYELPKTDATVIENYLPSNRSIDKSPFDNAGNGSADDATSLLGSSGKRLKPVAADIDFDRSVKLRKYKKKLMSSSASSSPSTSLANYEAAFTEFDQIDPTPHEVANESRSSAATVADGRADTENYREILSEIFHMYNGTPPTGGKIVRFLRSRANGSRWSVEIELNDANKTRLRLPMEVLFLRTTADGQTEKAAATAADENNDIPLSIKTIDFIEDNSVAMVDQQTRRSDKPDEIVAITADRQSEPNEIFEATRNGYKVNEDYRVTDNPLFAESRVADTDDRTTGTTLSDDRADRRDELFQASSTGSYRINDIYTIAFNDGAGINAEFVSQTAAPNLTTEPEPEEPRSTGGGGGGKDRNDYKREIGGSERVIDPAVPYPEEYPEEYQTIQNGPSIIITKTTYTSIPDVTYTTVTMATLPTFQQIEEAENAFIDSLAGGTEAKERLSNDASPPVASKTTSDSYRSESTTNDPSTTTESTANGTVNAASSRLNGTAETAPKTTTVPTTIDAQTRAKKNNGVVGRKVNRENGDAATRASAEGSVEATTAIAVLGEMSRRSESDEQYLAGAAELDDTDLNIIRNFVNKNLRLL